MSRQQYQDKLRALLYPAERRVFAKLSTPQKVQDYLDTLKFNFEESGETQMSPRRILQTKKAHCFEGAIFAAAALAYHGREVWLVDLRSSPRDHDHVVALFTERGRWGAISKTNHAVLRWRDPVYSNVRELGMSYFHEYFIQDGTKTMLSYSAPFSLARYAPARWVVAAEDLDWLGEALDDSPHFPIAPKKVLQRLRKASPIERKVGEVVEHRPSRN